MTANVHQALQVLPVIQTDRLQRLQRELAFAWERTSREDVMAWGKASGSGFVTATARRVKNVASLLGRAAKFVSNEAIVGYAAWQEKCLQSHLKSRVADAGNALQRTYHSVAGFGDQFAQAFRTDPKNAGVQLLTLVATSVAVSGGADGDGGAPDLDLMFGIDAHRSILSHSILMGAALEAGILSLLGAVKLVYDKLPDHHDGLWDDLHDISITVSQAASMGVSVGMAYHLLVDGLVQPAPYHDLPVDLPMEGHQAIFVANGVAEAVDAGKKSKSN